MLLTTTTAGADPDPNGYTLMLDGELVEECSPWDYGSCEVRLEPNGDRLFSVLGAPGKLRPGRLASF